MSNCSSCNGLGEIVSQWKCLQCDTWNTYSPDHDDIISCSNCPKYYSLSNPEWKARIDRKSYKCDSCNGTGYISYSSSSYSDNWWEYESGENFFKTIFLFPFRLIIWIIRKIIEFIETILKAIIAFLQTFVGIPYILFTLSITLGIMLPARIIVYILSFGNNTLWEDELFDWLASAMRWSVYLWNEFEHEFFKVLKVFAIIISISSWFGIIGII